MKRVGVSRRPAQKAEAIVGKIDELEADDLRTALNKMSVDATRALWAMALTRHTVLLSGVNNARDVCLHVRYVWVSHGTGHEPRPRGPPADSQAQTPKERGPASLPVTPWPSCA